MEGLFPLSKSTYGTWLICPRHVYNVKILKLSPGDRDTARVGRDVHDWRAKILSGATDYESSLTAISDPEVTDLLAQAIAKSVYTEIQDQKLEQHYQNDMVHGYIDRSGWINDKTLFVEDLKTGRWEKFDDIMERDIYSVLAWDNDAKPDTEAVLFVRYYCRSGNHHEFIYSKENIEEARERIAAGVEDVRASEPTPKPGAHCVRWFGGDPCAFHGTEHCPLAADVPALVDAAMPIEMQAIGQAFMSIYRGLRQEDIDPSIASLALQGVHQIEAAANIVESALKEWSDENGPIDVGDDRYGWQSVSDYEVDKIFALEAMLSSKMPIDEIARVINLSKTAIERISKRKYPNIRQSILDLAVTRNESSKRRFSRIKD